MASGRPDAAVDRTPAPDILEAMKHEYAELQDLVAPIFEGAKIGPLSVYLYGSRATAFVRSDSDFDFALIASSPIEREELATIRDALIDALPGVPDVDCVDMRSIPLTLAAQVIETSVLLLRGDDFQRNMLETRLLSMYAILNEERQGILNDIVERGSIYAR